MDTAEQKKVCIYSEDGWEARVELLEDCSDSEWFRFKLRVLSTIKEGRFGCYLPVEHEFQVERVKKLDGGYSGMWHLQTEDGDYLDIESPESTNETIPNRELAEAITEAYRKKYLPQTATLADIFSEIQAIKNQLGKQNEDTIDIVSLGKSPFKEFGESIRKARQLESMFDAQGKLNQRVNVDTVQIGLTGSEEEKAKWVNSFCTAIIQETAELRDSVPWKWWSKHQTFDLQNARVEVVDILHFLISVAQVLGMTSQDLFDAYMAKMEVNHKRQDSGYSEKDPNDSKHI